jgi:hypothetical protein
MTDVEACNRYEDSYVLMRMDSIESDMGTVLFIGDNEREIKDVLYGMENHAYCGIIEGANLLRSMGGVVVTSG